ncbi:MAG TPA: hypothetical protein VFE32_10650 [Puia sp.]|jgi:hypothetical protein|nr:hypothetical protein [Puia sp.]
MRKYLTAKILLRFLAVLSDLITVGLFAYAIITWGMNNIWCNPYIRIVICSLILTVIIFAVDPLLIKGGMINKWVRGCIGVFIFILCATIIYLIPKGDCAMQSTRPPLAKTADSISSRKAADTAKSEAPPVTDKPTVAKKHKQSSQNGEESKEPAKKEPSAQAPMFDLSHATFYGPVAIGPNAQQINEFRGKEDFRPLAYDIYQKVIRDLIKLKNNFPEMPVIELTNLSGSIATISAIDELRSILDSAGISVKEVPIGAGNTIGYGNSGFWAYRGSKDSAMISEFSRAITPFMTFKQGQFDELFHGEHSFRIYFLGAAEYKSSGEVFIH